MQIVYHILSSTCDWNALHSLYKALDLDSPTRILDQQNLPLHSLKAIPTLLRQYTDHAEAFVYLGFIFIVPESNVREFLILSTDITWAEVVTRKGYVILLASSHLTNWHKYVTILHQNTDLKEYAEQLTRILKRYE